MRTLLILATAIILAILPAMAAYGLTAWMLSRIPMTWISAPVIAAGSMLVAGRLFRRIPDAAIRQTIRLGPGVTLVRAAFAALVILAITGAARLVGPRWAGLFSAFFLERCGHRLHRLEQPFAAAIMRGVCPLLSLVFI